MRNELDAMRGPKHTYSAQWSDHDLAPIMKSMDALFNELGWIK